MTAPSPAVLDWLSRLIAIDTTSRDSNLPLVEAVAEHARSLGLEPHLFPTADGTKAALVVSVPDAAPTARAKSMCSFIAAHGPIMGRARTSTPAGAVSRQSPGCKKVGSPSAVTTSPTFAMRGMSRWMTACSPPTAATVTPPRSTRVSGAMP